MASNLEPISWDEALRSTNRARRHLLIGNGFSMAARDRFHYGSLLKVAKFRDEIAALFADLDTEDFEVVLRSLSDRLALAEEDEERQNLSHAIAEVRLGLGNALVAVHPATMSDIQDEEYRQSAKFLKYFIGTARPRGSQLFSTNYDMLLLWAVVKARLLHVSRLSARDGLMKLPWDRKSAANTDIFFLHGSLNLYTQHGKVWPIRYRDTATFGVGQSTGMRVIDRIKENLELNIYPLYVAEGSPEQKRSAIDQSDYLKEALRRFGKACCGPDDALFIIGNRLSEMDQHIASLVGAGHIGRVMIGIFKGFANETEVEHFGRLTCEWKAQRGAKGNPPVEVAIFDSRECEIWRQRKAAVTTEWPIESDPYNARGN